METKHIFIGDYINKSPKERIYHLLDNYKDFGKYRERYKDNVVDLMSGLDGHCPERPFGLLFLFV